jgi:prepilin peptidase CpaA
MLVGGLALLVVSGGLGAAGLMGMGDVKLLAAAGLCVRWPNALAVFLYTTIAGGALALVIAVGRGRIGAVARNLGNSASMDAKKSPHRMPYGIAIFAGVAWAVAARHLTQLSLLG